MAYRRPLRATKLCISLGVLIGAMLVHSIVWGSKQKQLASAFGDSLWNLGSLPPKIPNIKLTRLVISRTVHVWAPLIGPCNTYLLDNWVLFDGLYKCLGQSKEIFLILRNNTWMLMTRDSPVI